MILNKFLIDKVDLKPHIVMNKNIVKNIGMLFLLVIFASSCTSDQLPEPAESDCGALVPTYNNEIKTIIDQSCAFSGCHLDNAPGQFDTYAGLIPTLENSKFMTRVIIERANGTVGMPPDFTPEGRPKDLTNEQIELIDCWLQAGFPE